MKRNNRRILAGILAAILCLATGAGFADQSLEYCLPDGKHYLRLPMEMSWQQPSSDETDLMGIWLMPPDLEMLVFAYETQGTTVQALAEALTAAGKTAEVREIAGEDFLVFQDQDETDGASCVGYSFISEGMMVEISFFYATQAALDLTISIMESLHT